MRLDLRAASGLAVLTVVSLGACGGVTASAPAGGDGGSPEASSSSGTSGSSSGSSSSSSSGASSGSSSGSSGGSSSSVDAGRVPAHHRPGDAQCSTSAPAGDCASPGPPPGGCTSDSVCTAGTNGRCINQGGGPAADCFCTYDACIHDTDCPTGQTCACHGSPYTDGRGNTCVTGDCRVDADCGSGGYCSPSPLTPACGDSLAGYYCHTARDLCLDDSDCTTSPSFAGVPGCEYSTTDSRWECVQRPVCE